jgi:hypothetical protein
VTDANTSPDDAALAGYETIEAVDTVEAADDTIDTVETDDTEIEAVETGETGETEIDLDAIEAELDGVERALRQLAEGTYWNDGIGSAPIESA